MSYFCRLCDVDGTSTLKKKWLDCFENVSAVLFTVGLDTYDVRSKENDDKVTDRHGRSLKLEPAPASRR